MMNILVKPRQAATVAILKDSEAGQNPFEVLLLLRNAKSSFVPSNYVFPGGSMDEEDKNQEYLEFCTCAEEDHICRISPRLSLEKSLRFWVTAIRETFEESGLFFALHRNDHAPLTADSSLKLSLEEYRAALLQGTVTLLDILKAEDLILATHELTYLTSWVTPAYSPIRFDAKFFVAPSPVGQIVAHDNGEIVAHQWTPPAEALADNREGRLKMVLPTLHTLEGLARHKSIDEVISSL